MYSAPDLLHTLIVLLAAQGLTPESADPWRGWVVFKEFVRHVDEVPDPGISVCISDARDGRSVRLALMRQVVEEDGEWLHPAAGVVFEFVFPLEAMTDTDAAFEAWSYDFPTLEQFIDHVEQYADFARLMNTPATASVAYWEEA